jgi:hypothetical protein
MDGSVRLGLAAWMGEEGPIAPGLAATSAPDGLAAESDAREKSRLPAEPARPDRVRVPSAHLPASLPAYFLTAVDEWASPGGPPPGDLASSLPPGWMPAAGLLDRWAPVASAVQSPPSRPVVHDRAWPRRRGLGRRPAESLRPAPDSHLGLHDRISAAISGRHLRRSSWSASSFRLRPTRSAGQ